MTSTQVHPVDEKNSKASESSENKQTYQDVPQQQQPGYFNPQQQQPGYVNPQQQYQPQPGFINQQPGYIGQQPYTGYTPSK